MSGDESEKVISTLEDFRREWLHERKLRLALAAEKRHLEAQNINWQELSNKYAMAAQESLERAESAESKLQQVRGELEQACQLVAVANRDGGHYRAEHGMSAAVERGINNYNNLQAAAEVMRELVRLKRQKDAFVSTGPANQLDEYYECKAIAWAAAMELVDATPVSRRTKEVMDATTLDELVTITSKETGLSADEVRSEWFHEAIATLARIALLVGLDGRASISDTETAVHEEISRLRGERERFADELFRRGAMDNAPCFNCGYNGQGYWDSRIHPCVDRRIRALASRLETGEKKQ